MKIQRGDLLAKLNDASPGLTGNSLTVEQSDCFVFMGDTLYSFNDSIMVRVPNPLGVDMVVKGKDLLDLVAKLPDDELDVELEEGELRIKGTGGSRSYGITASAEPAMPVQEVPTPGKWSKLAEGTVQAMRQAARTCDRKSDDYLTTAVHVTPDLVEGTDQMRFLRVDGPTGFQERVLLPADAILELKGTELTKVSVGEGWTHFRTGQGATVSLRCAHGDYIDGVEDALKLKKPEKVVLPVSLKEAIERAEIFDHGGGDFKVGVKLSENRLILTARKEGGWGKEKQKMEYGGRPLNFMVAPDLLVEVLSHTREVQVDGSKMKIQWDRSVFVVCLDANENE